MGIANYPEIFQHKMDDLFDVSEFIRARIDDFFISTKGYWTDYMQKLERTLNKTKEKSLKYNIENSFFRKT